MFRIVMRSATLALALGAVGVHAGVNVNNGNYYVANTDFFLPTSGLNIEVTRTYNSRSSYVQGFFGVGWSSELEGYLKVNGKNVDYFEGGGGNIVSFVPSGQDKWINSLYGLQTLTKTKTGWVLEGVTGKLLSFDAQGKLARIADKNGNAIDVVYKAGLIDQLRDNFNNQVKFTWKEFNKKPRVIRIERDALKVSYTYSPIGNLTKAVGVDGVPYVYDYDDEHNMTKITYANGEYKAMAYNKSRDWITRFRDRDGMTTTYDYFSDSLDPENKFGTIVTRFQEGSKDREISKFWYEFRKRADGSKFNYRAVTSVRGVVSETIFTECCGTPLVVSQWPDSEKPGVSPRALEWTIAKGNKTTTSFDYYADGLLKKKTAPDGTVTTLSYDTKHRKVSSVQKGARKISYTYDANGNLATALDHSDNRSLKLGYDVQGRITSVAESVPEGKQVASRMVFFRYDGGGRPVEIKEKSASGEGVIRMKYSASGEVEGVFNAQGRALASDSEMEVARKVAMTFQNLLEIVQPAGVTLGPEG